MTHLLRSAYLPLLALCLALTASGVAQARVEVVGPAGLRSKVQRQFLAAAARYV